MNVEAIMAMAMNPNLSMEFINGKIKESEVRQKHALDDLIAQCEGMTLEQQTAHLSAMTPLILAL